MNDAIQEFFHDFRQELLAGAEVNSEFQLSMFMETVAAELEETGIIEGFELCHYRAQRGMRVDGYWFRDEGEADLFIADFEARAELSSLTKTDVEALFKRLENFFEASGQKNLYLSLEETSPEYGLSRDIADRFRRIRRINLFIFSERALSDRFQGLENQELSGVPVAHHIWDISRIYRQRSSRGHKEELDVNLVEIFGKGLPCLTAHFGRESYESYLAVIPADMLAGLYDRYGARLLEQNVRCFLQARGNVNKGIRSTILNEPMMFFAYNNGITATARKVETRNTESGAEITRLLDLQIVNGGQTTASLFHTKRRDKASLEEIFVQMKLTVIEDEKSEAVVPRISEYANTQNRVNAADFFSNHPFHVRMEEFSRRIWAPAKEGEQRETKWFYERARGQYADAQARMTKAEQRRFKAEFPKSQMFAKTDLAKFENAWDDHPKWVNFGAQKNFARYASRIGKEWSKDSDRFSEYYFKRAIARGILFRTTEKLVSVQEWYNGGYRANIVAYALAALAEVCRQESKVLDFERVWTFQGAPDDLEKSLVIAASFVNTTITSPPEGISNISEWCKKELCWTRIVDRLDELRKYLPKEFSVNLISSGEEKRHEQNAAATQRIDDGIDAQTRIFDIPAESWSIIREEGQKRRILTDKEVGILRVAEQMPAKIPTEKQSLVLVEVLRKAEMEGILNALN